MNAGGHALRTTKKRASATDSSLLEVSSSLREHQEKSLAKQQENFDALLVENQKSLTTSKKDCKHGLKVMDKNLKTEQGKADKIDQDRPDQRKQEKNEHSRIAEEEYSWVKND